MAVHPHFGDIMGLDLASWLARFPETPPIRGSIVLATGERTGSEWLCQLLAATERLGRPAELLNPGWFGRFIHDYPRDVVGAAAVAHRAGVTGNGVFCMKLHSQHFDRLVEAKVPLEQVFPNPVFVWLTRKDKLGQAISLCRARQSRRYHEYWGSDAPEAYDGESLSRILNEVTMLAMRWDCYFARNGVDPLHVTYEALQADPHGVIRSIGALVGVEIDSFVAQESLKVQRDRTSDEWRARFLSQTRDLSRFE